MMKSAKLKLPCPPSERDRYPNLDRATLLSTFDVVSYAELSRRLVVTDVKSEQTLVQGRTTLPRADHVCGGPTAALRISRNKGGESIAYLMVVA